MAQETSTLEFSSTEVTVEGIMVFTGQGKIVMTNPAAAGMFGYESHELTGKSINKIIKGIRTMPVKKKDEVSAPEKVRVKSIRKDKTEFLAELSLQHFSGGGDLLTMVCISEVNDQNKKFDETRSLANVETMNRDLHLQIQKRRTIEKKMMKLQRLYDTMVHNFPDGVIGVLDRNMEYVLIDGKDLNEIDLISLGLAGGVTSDHHNHEIAEETISKIKKAFEGDNVSFEVKTNDRYYHISAVPLPDPHNNINEILCVLKNITEKNKLEEGLLKALEKEKELGEFKSRFVTMACHEFKTPLATILSSTFLLENYSGADYVKEKAVHTNRIRRSVNNLTMILNEFLSLEKLEGNLVTVIYADINLPKYIRDLICEIEPLKQKGQDIIYEHSGDSETAYLDPHLLWSIITNLISNALKYSKENKKIFVTSWFQNNTITITVKDNGIGIPEEEHKHIFGRFNRARNAMNIEGTGLGLHIVEKKVKLLNGSISFTSQLNEGTEFTIAIPNGV